MWGTVLEVLPEGAAYFLSALAFSLVWSTRKGGLFHLALGGIVVLACGAFNRAIVAGMPLAAAVIVTIAGAGAIGWLVETLVYQPLRRTDASADVFLLSSFGLYLVLERIGAMWLGTAPLGLPQHLDIDQRVTIAGAAFSSTDLITLLIALILGTCTAIAYRGTVGIRIAALRQSSLLYDWRIGDSSTMLAAIGIASGAITAAAAILFSLEHRVVIDRVGMTFLIPGFLSVVVGDGLHQRLSRIHRRVDAFCVDRPATERATMVASYALTGIALATLEAATTAYLEPKWQNAVLAALSAVVFVAGAGREGRRAGIRGRAV